MPKVFLDDFLTPQAKAKAMQLANSKLLRTAAIIIFSIFIVITLLRLPTDTLKDIYRTSTATHSEAGQRDHAGVVNSWPNIDWSRYAYVQYVTNAEYLCNSVMIFEALHRLGSKAERLMMYPATFSDIDDSTEGKLLRKARDQYSVKLTPIQVQSRHGNDPLPRAYWLNFNDRVLSSQLMLIQPSTFEFHRIMDEIEKAGSNDYDMEIINHLYRDSALILPHRPYDLLTGEFRSTKHADYLGNAAEPWDPEKVLKEAKFLHFSDWPIPKVIKNYLNAS
ncbi:hypothetical protein IFM46972_10042 [Aspergillus udagawae]|uniref:Uncharacterized protein n=1 Tax=Aspergillus udagawae TaxID=91492 RepID=A0A8H3S9X3_9EURO|nr:hypothetical protein IFM46972_10042 [Aspergillus udagawae]